jgi:hypothetical protein
MHPALLRRWSNQCLLSLLLLLIVPADSIAGGATTVPAIIAPYPALPTVTLHLHDVSRKDLLDAFAEQTHVRFGEIQPGFWTTTTWPSSTVDLDFDNEPFWGALSRLQETADIGFVPLADFSSFQITKSRGSWGWTGRPETVCGPLLLSLRRVARQCTVHLGEPDKPSLELSFVMIAQPPPGQLYLGDERGCSITAASDESGRDLLADASATVTTVVDAQPKLGHLLNIRAQLSIPAGQTPKLVTLSGTLRADFVEGSASIERADPEQQPINCEIVGNPMQITVHRHPNLIEVSVVAVRPESKTKAEYGRFGRRLFTNWSPALKLTDSAGQMLRVSTANSSFDGERLAVHLDFVPGGAQGPLALSWIVPATEHEYTIPWTLDQIPLP